MLDTDNDNRVDFAEFEQGVVLVREWGCDVQDPVAAFGQLDSDGGGRILFNEFCDWALSMHLNLEVEGTEDDAEDEQIEYDAAKGAWSA
jgi:Ca2+-binding EF-hand superfamily protein